MCRDCLQCRDPQIYCKFRSACAIHFITKRKGNLDNEESSPPQKSCGACGLKN
jgi:hypothetical protein